MNNKLISHVAIHKYRHRCRNDEIVYNNMPITTDKHLSSNNALLHSTAQHQSGAVLIVSLIMLLLLTLIGVTGSQVTGLEEKMAGNSRDYNLAFQAAESALRAGEAASTGSPVFYTGSTQPINWANAAVTTYSGGTLTGIYQNPVYIIESLPTTYSKIGAGESLEAGALPSSTSIFWYRITARGMGGTANALVTLQSIYRR
jgi:type IV pilus assembly protein PilX